MKRLAWIAVAVLALSLVPLLMMGAYVHPLTDDYVFGAATHLAWLQTHSVAAAVEAAAGVAADMYRTWQGTYTGCFLMALQPGAFGAYWLTPFILIGSFLASSYTLAWVLLRRVLGATKAEFWAVATIFALMSMQLLVSPYDAYYWFNGSVYYTFYYSLAMFLAAALVSYAQAPVRSPRKALLGTAAMLLGVFIAGGNFVTGLAVPVLLASAIGLLAVSGKRVPRLFYALLAVYAVAFVASIAAPGNANRIMVDGGSMNPVAAIAASAVKPIHFIYKQSSPVALLMLAVAAPALARLARRSPFRFDHPWLCLLATYAMFCAFFVPTLYAMGQKGPFRVMNLYVYNYVWFAFINIYYISGALARKAERGGVVSSDIMSMFSHFKTRFAALRSHSTALSAAALVLGVVASTSSSSRVASLMRKGKAQAFDRQMDLRERQMARGGSDIVLQPLETAMPTDCFNDVSIYPGYWVNQGMRMYYGKRSVAAADTVRHDDAKQILLAKCRREVGPGNLKFRH